MFAAATDQGPSGIEIGTMVAAFLAVALSLAALSVSYYRGVGARRHLNWWIEERTPLAPGAQNSWFQSMVVNHSGDMYGNLWFVRLRIHNPSWRDIYADTFGNVLPLVFKFGVLTKIVQLVGTSPKTLTPGHPAPIVELGEPEIRVGPQLIRSRQVIAVDLLVNGRKPSLDVVNNPINHCEIKPRNTGRHRRTLGLAAAWLLAFFALTSALAFGIGWMVGSDQIAAVAIGAAIGIALCLFSLLTWYVITRYRKERDADKAFNSIVLG